MSHARVEVWVPILYGLPTSNKTFKPYCIGYNKYTDIQYDSLNMFPVLKTYASRFNKIPQLGVSFVYNLIL
jgi:hypothetical protein